MDHSSRRLSRLWPKPACRPRSLATTIPCSKLCGRSLANSRIINSSMSPQADLYITLKFRVDAPYNKLQLFNSAFEQFLTNRPREWLSFFDFRAVQVDASKGFIEYIAAVQHLHSWCDWGTIMLSKAHLIHFSLELSKKLDIWYSQPLGHRAARHTTIQYGRCLDRQRRRVQVPSEIVEVSDSDIAWVRDQLTRIV
jgi:hypothetical protein